MGRSLWLLIVLFPVACIVGMWTRAAGQVPRTVPTAAAAVSSPSTCGVLRYDNSPLTCGNITLRLQAAQSPATGYFTFLSGTVTTTDPATVGFRITITNTNGWPTPKNILEIQNSSACSISPSQSIACGNSSGGVFTIYDYAGIDSITVEELKRSATFTRQ